MKIVSILLAVAGVAILAVGGVFVYFEYSANPRIERELIADPEGERAQKVMLITLPSGRRIPVNFLREGDRVYAGADGGWWEELVGDGDGLRVTLLVKGETLQGLARAVEDDPEYTRDVFSRLRPNAIEGFGTLVEIRLE
jgi:hypothetical protein